MTRPTDDQIAELLRDLALLARTYCAHLQPGDELMAESVYSTIHRARAAADQLTGEQP